jgi:hypothetical protein
MGKTEQHTGQQADCVQAHAGTAGQAMEPAANTSGEAAGEMWAPGYPADYPAGARRTDTWVLVCGGIAAAAAFAAAFVAAGGVAGAAGQHAVPGSTVPAVVSQACPSAAP